MCAVVINGQYLGPTCAQKFHTCIHSKNIIIRDNVIELAKFKKMFMPSVDTRGQQQSRVVKWRGTPGQLLTPHNGNAPAPHSKCPHVQHGTVLAAFVAKS